MVNTDNENIIISCDLSLRSSGIVALEQPKNYWPRLIDFRTIDNKESSEDLLITNFENVVDFMSTLRKNITAIVIEGLAYKLIGKHADLLIGNHWFTRASLHRMFADISIYVYPVTQWRKEFISKERTRELKKSGEKHFIKKEAVRVLPLEVRKEFEEYANMKKPVTLSYDLADAYLMGTYFYCQPINERKIL